MRELSFAVVVMSIGAPAIVCMIIRVVFADGLLSSSRGKTRPMIGRRAGMEAHIMPTLSSAADQVAAPTLSYVISFDLLAT